MGQMGRMSLMRDNTVLLICAPGYTKLLNKDAIPKPHGVTNYSSVIQKLNISNLIYTGLFTFYNAIIYILTIRSDLYPEPSQVPELDRR